MVKASFTILRNRALIGCVHSIIRTVAVGSSVEFSPSCVPRVAGRQVEPVSIGPVGFGYGGGRSRPPPLSFGHGHLPDSEFPRSTAH